MTPAEMIRMALVQLQMAEAATKTSRMLLESAVMQNRPGRRPDREGAVDTVSTFGGPEVEEEQPELRQVSLEELREMLESRRGSRGQGQPAETEVQNVRS